MTDIRIITKSFTETTVSVEPTSQIGRDWFEDQFGLGCIKSVLPKSEVQAFLEAVYHAALKHEVRDGAWRYLEAVR